MRTHPVIAVVALLIALTATPGCSQAENVTLEPVLYIDHGDMANAEFSTDVYIGPDRTLELRSLVVASIEAAADHDSGDVSRLDLIDDAVSDEFFFVTAGYYCGSGDFVLDVERGRLALRTTGIVLCDAPAPVSSVFRVERDAVGADFELLERGDGDAATREVLRVEDWAIVD